VVFLIGVELIDVKGMHKIWIQRPSEFWVALITAVVVIFVGVEEGILLAMVLSLIEHVRRSYRSKNVIVVPDNTGGWRLLPVTAPEQLRSGLLVYRFAHIMYYANAQQLSEEVVDLANGAQPPLVWFCIEASAVADVDFTAASTLRDIHGILKSQEIKLVFCNLINPGRYPEPRKGHCLGGSHLRKFQRIHSPNIGRDGNRSQLPDRHNPLPVHHARCAVYSEANRQQQYTQRRRTGRAT
jgi:MFS superfamily sulfate permease-like transporter